MELEVKYEMLVKSQHGEWYEPLDGEPKPKTDEQAKEQAKDTVDFFNRTLREGEAMRYLKGIRKIEVLMTITEIDLP